MYMGSGGAEHMGCSAVLVCQPHATTCQVYPSEPCAADQDNHEERTAWGSWGLLQCLESQVQIHGRAIDTLGCQTDLRELDVAY